MAGIECDDHNILRFVRHKKHFLRFGVLGNAVFRLLIVYSLFYYRYSILLTIRLSVVPGLMRIQAVGTASHSHLEPSNQCTHQAWNHAIIAVGRRKTASIGGARVANSGHPVRLNRLPETPQVLADSNTVEIEARATPPDGYGKGGVDHQH